MEIRTTILHRVKYAIRLCVLLSAFLMMDFQLFSQPFIKSYKVKDGKMFITISKQINEPSLDSFIVQYQLSDLALKEFIQNNLADSLIKFGWSVTINTPEIIVLSKSMMSLENISSPIEKLLHTNVADLADNSAYQSSYGYNKFKNKHDFLVKDERVIFYLRNNKPAKKVLLAGSFTKWETNAIAMVKTDSGWIADVQLPPGKYWYKFIIDNEWQSDFDNLQMENDGHGNINSVYYKTNFELTFPSFLNAKKVYLSGSFNEWREKEILMMKTATAWRLPIYLDRGTHTYKFIADGKWYNDENNVNRLPDGHGGYNSVLTIGPAHMFNLKDHSDAKEVFLVGSFNGWKEKELGMTKTNDGWKLPYALAPGNYEYKFWVDGKYIPDPANPIRSGNNFNSFIVVEPNYTFRVRGLENAKEVYLAGDFNNWDPNSIKMKKTGSEWTYDVFLKPGKHSYKYFVDGSWIKDPGNKLWEQNEFGTGNSVVWIENPAFFN